MAKLKRIIGHPRPEWPVSDDAAQWWHNLTRSPFPRTFRWADNDHRYWQGVLDAVHGREDMQHIATLAQDVLDGLSPGGMPGGRVDLVWVDE